MANTTTNHSDLPCSCSTLEAYVDGLCPGCTEAADRDADLKEHLDLQNECIYPQPTGNAFPQEMIDDAFEGDDVREGDDDRYYSGTGERMDDESYERYLNRG